MGIHSAAVLKRGDTAIVLNRVSTRKQKPELPVYRRAIRKWCRRHGVTIARIFKHVGQGSQLSWLKEPIRLARDHRYTLLAWSIDRAIRPTEDPYMKPKPEDIERLTKKLKGVTLATIIPPDLSAKKVNARRTRLFQKVRNKHGGKHRPPSARRQDYRDLAKALHRQGESYAQIARIVDEPNRQTIKNWCLNRYLEDG